MLQRETNKVGINGITFEVKQTCSKEEGGFQECVWMNAMSKTHDVCNLSRAQNHSFHRYGPPEVHEKYKVCDEARAKMSASRKGRPGRKITSEQSAYMNSFPKPPITEERREQFRALGRSWGKQVKNVSTGEIFPSIRQAALSVGCTTSVISKAIMNRGKAMGFAWALENDSLMPKRITSDKARKALVEAGKRFYRPVINETTNTVFVSQSAAARAYGVSPQRIYSACVGKVKLVAGCQWAYHTIPECSRKRRLTQRSPADAL